MAHHGPVTDPQFDAPDIYEDLWAECERDIAQRMTESREDVCEELWRPDDSLDHLIVALALIINSPHGADCGYKIAEAKRLMHERMLHRVKTEPALQEKVRNAYLDAERTLIDEAAYEAAVSRQREFGDDE